MQSKGVISTIINSKLADTSDITAQELRETLSPILDETFGEYAKVDGTVDFFESTNSGLAIDLQFNKQGGTVFLWGTVTNVSNSNQGGEIGVFNEAEMASKSGEVFANVTSKVSCRIFVTNDALYIGNLAPSEQIIFSLTYKTQL